MSATATTSNADRIRAMFDRLNAHDTAGMAELWTDDTRVRFPDRSATGRQELIGYFEELFAGVPDFRMDIQSIVEHRDDVFVRWIGTGTHRGTIQGIEATGRRIELDGMDHITMRDGSIASNFVVFDQMQWARALGLLPPQDSPADKAVKAAFNLRTRALRRLRSRG